eukprot:CCRYP_014782-RA/>CCRYP_014782-RA protein AED:0.01 eAED:0.00 QI:0/-1/0/1/-1/1/1/0/567
MSTNNATIYGGTYLGPAYHITGSVLRLRALPRFGYQHDITELFTSNPDEQASYATGLIVLFVFILLFFLLWTSLLLILKCMGPGNAGFLSGHPFVIPDRAEDDQQLYKRPLRVRLAFLSSCIILMIFSLLFVTMGLTNVDNTATSMSASLRQLGDLVGQAEVIAQKLEEVGNSAIAIRDSAVEELGNFCPANPNLDAYAGVNAMEIAGRAKNDLTTLANFIRDGLSILRTNLNRVEVWSGRADDVVLEWNLWGWQFKLLSAGLFILPAFLMMGVGLVMLDLDIKCYQKTLTYVFMPLFCVVTVTSYVVCALVLPVSAVMADTCIGGGQAYGGPDDTVLTIFRNLRGDDTSILFLLIAYYTQRCNSIYYPFGQVTKYLDDLDGAIDSTNTVIDVVQNNLDLLLDQCGRSYDSVVSLMKDVNISLRTLRNSADQTLNLVQCRNINELYVNTVHDATCTYSVEALAWIFGTSLVISVCGLIIIMFRAAYYPEEYLELSKSWITAPASTITTPSRTGSGDSDDVFAVQRSGLELKGSPERHDRNQNPSLWPPRKGPRYVTDPNEHTEAVEL